MEIIQGKPDRDAIEVFINEVFNALEAKENARRDTKHKPIRYRDRFVDGDQFSVLVRVKGSYRGNGGAEIPYDNGIIEPENLKIVDHYGGEDMGTEYWIVYSLKLPNYTEPVLLKFDGRYDSWNGTDWYSDFDIVEQHQETRIVNVYKVIE